jgi:hypothetical protein
MSKNWHGELWCPICEEPIPYLASASPRTLDYPGDADADLDLDKHENCHLTQDQQDHLVKIAINYEGICSCCGFQ